MSIHNICFCGERRKISILFLIKKKMPYLELCATYEKAEFHD